MDQSKAVNLNKLTTEQLSVIKDGTTEPAFSGKLLNNKLHGIYTCIGCGTKLFASDTKFDSGSGWPSFDQAIAGSVKQITDTSNGMVRTEVICTNCGAHLGHVFNDGPRDTTGQRFCINSISLDFQQKK